MTRRKRAYVPKVKGCYECSQRRIHCDRAQPRCGKCEAKGLSCSGLGIRYRFNDDVIRRSTHDDPRGRQWDLGAGRRSSFVLGSSGSTTASDDPQVAGPNAGRSENFNFNEPLAEPALRHYDTFDDGIDDASGATPLQNSSPDTEDDEIQDPTIAQVQPENALSLIPVKSFQTWEEYLLQHFSDKIAPEMVPVDDQRNGWRRLILPLAHTDQLIRDAVLSASAFHFSSTVSTHQFAPGAIYHRAIRRLRGRQDLEHYSVDEKQIVVLSLLVFLATVLVSGSSDYRIVLKLLEAAVSAAGGDDILKDGELGLFIVRQIHKFRGYASPLLGQAEGIAILSQTSTIIRPSSSPGWEDFTAYYRYYTNHQHSMSLVYDLHEQACGIYVQRAQAGPDGPALTTEVSNFRATLDKFPPGSAAEQILVWPIFLAALESTTVEDQEYFANQLMAHHQRNGFANILTALEYLKRVWSKQTRSSWTQLLPSMEAFIV